MDKKALTDLYRSLQSVRFHHLSGVLGVSLALSAFLALGGCGNWTRLDEQAGPVTLNRAETTEPTIQATPVGLEEGTVSDVVQFLVRTREQGDLLLRAIHHMEEAGGESSTRYGVLVEDTPDLQRLMLVATKELSIFDVAVTVIDLR